MRAGFHGSQEVWTRDVLNLGVKPDMLIAKVFIISCLTPIQDVLSDD